MLRAILKNKNIQIETVPIPVPRENEKLVRLEYCGICGHDYHTFMDSPNDIINWGHEIVGHVSDINGNISDRVAIRTTFPCGECEICLRKQYYKCLNGKRAVINGYAEYVAINENCIIPINTKNDISEYALIEPLYVAINLVKRISPDKNDRIAIIGNGTIGLLTAFYLWSINHKNICIYARNTQGVRKQFAKSLGIRTCNYNGIVESDFQKANKIVNTAPYETMPVIIKHASPHAFITFNGYNENNIIPLDMKIWHVKNLTISPSFPHPQTGFSDAINIIETFGKKLSSLITHVFTLNEAPKAFQAMKNKKIDFIKVLIKGMQKT